MMAESSVERYILRLLQTNFKCTYTTMEAANDAFAMFGSDDDEDETETSTLKSNARQEVSRQLIFDAGNRNNRNQGANLTDNYKSIPVSSPRTSEDYLRNLDAPNRLVLPWKVPQYLGPMSLIHSLESFGGGRGYVALENLAPGTLVLVEEPIVAWQGFEGVEFGLDMVQLVLITNEAQTILHDMEHFHPTKAAVDAATQEDEHEQDVTQIMDMIERLRNKFKDGDQLNECVTLAQRRGLSNANATLLDATDSLRLLLAIQYNSLESGIYLHAAMLNHADQPNCVKFAPANDKKYSEVRTTRKVQAGEPLTISYLPRILSHASRRKHLYEQHRFDIGANLGPHLRRMELIGGNLPRSTTNKWDDDSATNRIEMATAELRELHQDAEGDLLDEEHVKGLEQALLELCRQAQEQLKNDMHVLLIPCFELHLDCCDRVQRISSLSGGQRGLLLCRVVQTAHQLVTLQELFHGRDHFALARTHLDLAQAVEELLSRSPKQLMSLQVNDIHTVSAWSSFADKARKEHNRIKSLYPYDVDAWIEKQKDDA
ncbi:hypothetical protein MPSEU_000862100 [Mayamaea pseudoterrestris]|nr:hypothetical protein MPSEU_000862100 [Mayamaea pseudoterrestris]